MTNPTPKEILEGLEKIQAVHKDLYESEFEQAEYYPSIDTSIAESSFDAHELIQAAIDYIKATMWVPIKDIPEEWKDGRPVDLIIETDSGMHREVDCYRHQHRQAWFQKDKKGNVHDILEYDMSPIVRVAFVMAPIPLSALGEPE